MFSFDKIKLVIWDLDETFWKGTISEGTINIPKEHIDLIKRLIDIGIMNSICSKNTLEIVKKELEKEGLWDDFVFPSVNWEAKGGRIKHLISDMQLRPVNVLFIDDNSSNLNEALYYCEGIMTASPSDIPKLIDEAKKSLKTDYSHSRLRQYKVLEEKKEKKKMFTSNEEFLYSSNIQLEFREDCLANIKRIHNLVWRSNQLNFTKIRSSEEELKELFRDDSYKCGYVTVCDRFGDYGIVGFYALKNNKLKHFCFSCRTLGMGIEQYVYIMLKKPELKIEGEVISNLNIEELPGWINQRKTKKGNHSYKDNENKKQDVLIKGPCDLFQILPYIANRNCIDTEFTYVTKKGFVVESTGHTTHMVEAIRLSDEQKGRVFSEVPFTDQGMYSDNLYKKEYKVVVLSVLQDANLGVYRRKETGERIAFLEGFYPLTDVDNWEGYINGAYYNAGFRFTKKILEEFASKYEFIGINTAEQIVDNLKYVREHLPNECTMAVMLGGELYYEKNTNPAYTNRHLIHKEINDAIRAVASEIGIYLIDVNKYLVDQSSFYDHFNHYIKPIYYQLAGDIVSLINEKTDKKIKETAKIKMLQIKMKEIIAPFYYKILEMLGRK